WSTSSARAGWRVSARSTPWTLPWVAGDAAIVGGNAPPVRRSGDRGGAGAGIVPVRSHPARRWPATAPRRRKRRSPRMGRPRRVGDLYRLSGPDTLRRFRQGRDELLRNHPQSPLALQARQRFNGLRYFDPDPAAKVRCRLEPADPGDPLEIDTGGEDGVITYRRTGRLAFAFNGRPCTLTVFSLVGYGGGLFLPFRDSTSGTEAYGCGRYPLDPVKNQDGLSP